MNETAPRVWLIDSHAQIFRAWHVWPPALRDADGEVCNALHGFADFLLELLESLARSESGPLHLACAFDSPGSRRYRQSIYPAYKAHRPPPPAELTPQFERCRALALAAGIPIFAAPEHESDDVIGTLCARLRARGHALTLLTGDKDLAQLIRENDRWWNPLRREVLDQAGVKRAFGVRPEQIPDLLALTGDSSDNIPGVPGIGPRTAARLLEKHGDIDQLYAFLERVGMMREGVAGRGATRTQRLLAEHADTVRLARRLTGVVCDLPLAEDRVRLQPTDSAAFDAQLRQLRVDATRRRRWASVLDELGAR